MPYKCGMGIIFNNFQGDKGMKKRMAAAALIISIILTGCASVPD